ncbi:XRE-family transcriptional regulator [Bacillus phage Eldridge]|uniref:XRE-family transcriptional regulator n=1 Tax=Bacillus phage Eldridge TaxID=1776293 RepID=A0A109QIV3_9CAUD|nr:XRE-family transcriptional regulator [Bacillus phage Eldridge]AMB18776.1 XRE-family transcriptional regulator [Bacillus phage Eldridge]
MAIRKYEFKLKIKQLLAEKGLSQAELAEMTGLRRATISEMSRNSRSVLNKVHVAKVMDALDVNELDQILELVITDEF